MPVPSPCLGGPATTRSSSSPRSPPRAAAEGDPHVAGGLARSRSGSQTVPGPSGHRAPARRRPSPRGRRRTGAGDDQRAAVGAGRVGAEGQLGDRHGRGQLGPAGPLQPAVGRVEPEVAGQGRAQGRVVGPDAGDAVSGGGSTVQRPSVVRTTSKPCRQRLTSSSGVQLRGSGPMKTASYSVAGSWRTTGSPVRRERTVGLLAAVGAPAGRERLAAVGERVGEVGVLVGRRLAQQLAVERGVPRPARGCSPASSRRPGGCRRRRRADQDVGGEVDVRRLVRLQGDLVDGRQHQRQRPRPARRARRPASGRCQHHAMPYAASTASAGIAKSSWRRPW